MCIFICIQYIMHISYTTKCMFGHIELATQYIIQWLEKCQIQPDNKENTKATHYWLFVWWIQMRPADTPHNGTVLHKVVAFHHIIMPRPWLCHQPTDGILPLTITPKWTPPERRFKLQPSTTFRWTLEVNVYILYFLKKYDLSTVYSFWEKIIIC